MNLKFCQFAVSDLATLDASQSGLGLGRVGVKICAAIAITLIGVNGLKAASLEQIRVSHSNAATRVVLDLSAATKFGSGSAANPDRYFVDLIDSDLDGGLNDRLDAQSLSTPFVAGIRTGKRKPASVRVVLDLAGRFDIKTTLLRPSGAHGHRLVIDVMDPSASSRRRDRSDHLLSVAGKRGRVKAPIESKVIGNSAGVVASNRQQGALDGVGNVSSHVSSQSDSVSTTATPAQATQVTQAAQNSAEAGGENEKDRVIVIDAGHGGKDPGAVGKKRTYEKDIVLAIARYVAEQVDEIPGYRALMTRTDDTYIPLRDRAEIARKNHAYAFISIHADGSKRASVRGSSVYSLTDGAKTNARTKKLAEHMNANDDRNLVDTLMALSTAKTQELGFDLGKAIMRELRRVTPAHIDEVEKANFRVLLAPGVPTILVETGFITNPAEEKQLRSKGHQKATARAIVDGLKQFLRENESKLTNAEGQESRG